MNNFFKRLLEHCLFTFITLLIFFVLVFVSIKILKLVEGSSYEPQIPGENFEYLYSHDEIAKSLQIASVKTEPDTHQLTITGRVHNISNRRWQAVDLNAIYYVEDIEMGHCGYSQVIDLLEPGTSHHFSSVCPLNTDKLPSRFSYKVFFSSGQRENLK
jgi:hypothetical protein